MPAGRKKILLVGTDARTDALAAACLASSSHPQLFAYAELRSPGLLEKCEGRVEVGAVTDVEAIVDHVRTIAPDLVIVGPEGPLGAGLVDAILELDICCFGPRRLLAQVETSKIWTRTVAARHQVPGAPRFAVVQEPGELRSVLEAFADFVVKPDGLTGGKGVKVFGEHLASIDEAAAYALEILEGDGRVLIEERLTGQEFSLMSITDGATVVHCPVVQDHKRAFDGDTGPNTGGMGSYSCADFTMPFLTDADLAQARAINEQMVRALALETGLPYQGVLYGGFMATADGVRLIEYNARFGDPEAMNVLPLLESDFVDICEAVATRRLADVPVRFAHKATVCKYVVPLSYPGGEGKAGAVSVPAAVQAIENLSYYWAAVELVDGQPMLTGSRALAFTGIGDTLAEAEQLAERGAASVQGPVRYRRDIGTAAAVARRSEQMSALRSSQ